MNTIRDVSILVQSNPQDFHVLVSSFVADFRRTCVSTNCDTLIVYRMVMDEPIHSDHPDVWSTYLASMVEALVEELGDKGTRLTPPWVYNSRYYLPEPTFWVRDPSVIEGLEDRLRANAHPCFAKRNLFFSKTVLKQV